MTVVAVNGRPVVPPDPEEQARPAPRAGQWWAHAWASPLARDIAAVLAVLAVTLAAAALIAAVTVLAWSAP